MKKFTLISCISCWLQYQQSAMAIFIILSTVFCPEGFDAMSFNPGFKIPYPFPFAKQQHVSLPGRIVF
ncbi:hypothetical protein [Ferruginibacter sp.]|uniref:hypothetical protein n=1 Tax=Ferruginibacter sp. TaxID=1940288 RepID=UPI00265A8B16|nr:hypothetical protein [Ferruginibacter sp.]